MPPPDYTDVAKITDVAPGEKKVVVIEGERYVLVNLDGEFAAILDECGHATALLSKGKLEEGCNSLPSPLCPLRPAHRRSGGGPLG